MAIGRNPADSHHFKLFVETMLPFHQVNSIRFILNRKWSVEFVGDFSERSVELERSVGRER